MFFFTRICAVLAVLIELSIHVWAHKKNCRNLNPNIYYRSPLHIFTSQFCIVCRHESSMDQVIKLQDQRSKHWRLSLKNVAKNIYWSVLVRGKIITDASYVNKCNCIFTTTRTIYEQLFFFVTERFLAWYIPTASIKKYLKKTTTFPSILRQLIESHCGAVVMMIDAHHTSICPIFLRSGDTSNSHPVLVMISSMATSSPISINVKPFSLSTSNTAWIKNICH